MRAYPLIATFPNNVYPDFLLPLVSKNLRTIAAGRG